MPGIEISKVTKEAPRPANKSYKEGYVPSYVLLKFPNLEGIKDREAKQLAGLDVIMLGVLADHGKVFQRVNGIEPLSLNVSDFPAFPANDDKDLPLFSMDDSTIRFIRQRSELLIDNKHDISEGRVKDWFLRSFTLWNRFMRHPETRDLLDLSVGNASFPLNSDGLYSAWEASGLPKFVNPVTNETQLHIPNKY